LSKSEFKNKEKEEIYLDEVTIDSIQELSYLANSKKIKVLNTIEEPLQIFGYNHLLKVAIKNLIKNAIEFSYENSEVIVRNYTLNEKKIIEIEDKGIGIKQKEQNKIFEQFYRTDKSRDKKSGGLGLGMAISKKIIDIHNGNIIITSKEHLGTIVRIEFL
jgi:signal transduction histidine kinase